jgi:hypothetical protein
MTTCETPSNAARIFIDVPRHAHLADKHGGSRPRKDKTAKFTIERLGEAPSEGQEIVEAIYAPRLVMLLLEARHHQRT